MFSSCVETLGLRESNPVLHITRTAQAISETIRLPSGQPVVIYDRYQGRTYNRMNRFMFEDFPRDLVVRFFLRHMRIALFAAGLVPPAAYTGLLLKAWPVGGTASSEPPPPADSEARNVYTTLQEWFVIAHEVAHLAVQAGKVDRHLEDLVDLGVARLAARPLPAGFPEWLSDQHREDDIAGATAVLGSEAQDYFEAGPRTEDLPHLDLDAQESFRRNLPAVLETAPHIREEALCDLLAAMVVIDGSKLAPWFVAPALRLGLANHVTLTTLRRELVRRFAAAGSEGDESHIVHTGLRGWLFSEIWHEFVKEAGTQEHLADYERLMAVQQPQHDRRVRSVANWAPSLVVAGSRRGMFEATTASTWPQLWVRADILEEMGSNNPARSSPATPGPSPNTSAQNEANVSARSRTIIWPDASRRLSEICAIAGRVAARRYLNLRAITVTDTTSQAREITSAELSEIEQSASAVTCVTFRFSSSEGAAVSLSIVPGHVTIRTEAPDNEFSNYIAERIVMVFTTAFGLAEGLLTDDTHVGDSPDVNATPLLHCSFCGKNQTLVKTLIAGPGVYICNDCVDLCGELLSESVTAGEFQDTDQPDP